MTYSLITLVDDQGAPVSVIPWSKEWVPGNGIPYDPAAHATLRSSLPSGDQADLDEWEVQFFRQQVNLERARRVAAGTVVSVTGYATPITLQGRDEDQRTLQGLCTAAQIRIGQGDVTTLTKYRDMDNVDHMLTPPQIVEMWSLGSAWVSAVYQASWLIKDMDPHPADHTDDALWPL